MAEATDVDDVVDDAAAAAAEAFGEGPDDDGDDSGSCPWGCSGIVGVSSALLGDFLVGGFLGVDAVDDPGLLTAALLCPEISGNSLKNLACSLSSAMSVSTVPVWRVLIVLADDPEALEVVDSFPDSAVSYESNSSLTMGVAAAVFLEMGWRGVVAPAPWPVWSGFGPVLSPTSWPANASRRAVPVLGSWAGGRSPGGGGRRRHFRKPIGCDPEAFCPRNPYDFWFSFSILAEPFFSRLFRRKGCVRILQPSKYVLLQ